MTALEPHRVAAVNLAKDSENRMHDDSVAKRFGFRGGLVPGVDVFAYMSHMPVAKWGRAFLETGRMEGRFLKPVYDGETATVTAQEDGGGLALRVDSAGDLCATGQAALPEEPHRIALDDFESVTPVSQRAPVDDASFPVGQWLGIAPAVLTEAQVRDYLRDIGETDPLYLREGILHTGLLLRTLNSALMENAVLGPWIHVGSVLRFLGTAAIGEPLTLRARVTGNYERKGHRFVDLDAVILADGRPVAHCQHVSIVRPRETLAA